MTNTNAIECKKKPPKEAKGDCAICEGWVDDGMGGCCVFVVDYWQPSCPYDKEER